MAEHPDTDRRDTRELSFWGWGYAERFPGWLHRVALAVAAHTRLGVKGLRPRRPPRLEAVSVPPSGVAPPADLPFVTDGREARLRHARGRAFPDLVHGFRGDFSTAPDLVARPGTPGEVERTLAWAAAERVAVVPYGGGTSVVGGVEPEAGPGHRGTLSLDLKALDRVLEVDDVSRLARIQAGATGPRLEAQLAAAGGWTLRFYPQSFELSTLGGWIATRAGGHFATRETHIDELVVSLTAAAPAGVSETPCLPASGAGPDPDRLLLGSEGTLGVVTEAWMRIRPRPRHRAKASVHFSSWEGALDAVRRIVQSDLGPSGCRLLDGTEASLHRVSSSGSPVLLLGFESATHPVADPLECALAITRRHGGSCPEGPKIRDGEPSHRGGGSGRWRRAFFEAPYLQSALVSLGAVVDTFETCCTWRAFPELHRAVLGEVGEILGELGGGVVSCRLTHVYPSGPAPYYTFIAPAGPDGQIATWRRIKAAATEAILAHGGAVTHHHAVGRIHRDGYERQVPGPTRQALAAAKASLDPTGILNPHVLLPVTEPDDVSAG